MRSVDLRIPLLAGVAIALLTVSPARAASDVPEILFVSGTGLAEEADLPEAQQPDADKTDISDAQADLNELSAKMADPGTQEGLAKAVESMAETMLDLPIGKFVAAVEQSVPSTKKGHKRIRPNDTLADVAGRDADLLPEQLANGSRQMMGLMSGLAAAFATVLPEFEKMGEAMEESFEDFEDVLPETN